MNFGLISQGTPGLVPQNGGSLQNPGFGVDTVNASLLLNTGNGWTYASVSLVSKTVALAQAANIANVNTYTAPVSGMYRVDIYEVSTNVPTGATLPAATVVYTDLDANVAVTDTLASVAAVSAAGVVNAGTFLVNVKVGGTIVIATTSYAAGSGTALQYAVKTRITYLG